MSENYSTESHRFALKWENACLKKPIVSENWKKKNKTEKKTNLRLDERNLSW